MSQLPSFAAATCCALVALTFAPMVEMRMVLDSPGLAALSGPGLLGLGLLGLWGMWWQGERGTVVAGVVLALLVDALWLMQPMNLT